MPGKYGETTVGVCVVRAEADASAGLTITVTARPDVDDDAGESVLHTASIAAALAKVGEFLAAAERKSAT
jgi:hypothetical protein